MPHTAKLIESLVNTRFITKI